MSGSEFSTNSSVKRVEVETSVVVVESTADTVVVVVAESVVVVLGEVKLISVTKASSGTSVSVFFLSVFSLKISMALSKASAIWNRMKNSSHEIVWG